MKILIAGSGGFCSALVARYKREKHDVYVISGVAKEIDMPAAQQIQGCTEYGFSLSDEKLDFVYSNILPDVVIYLGAVDDVFDWDNRQKASSRFLAGLSNMLCISASSGVKRFVFLSTTDVYKTMEGDIDERSPKRPADIRNLIYSQGEELCREFNKNIGMDCVVLRFDNVYGWKSNAREDFACKLLRTAMEGDNTPPKEKLFTPTYLSDAIDAVYKTTDNLHVRSGIYNVSGVESLMSEAYYKVCELCSIPPVDMNAAGGVELKKKWSLRKGKARVEAENKKRARREEIARAKEEKKRIAREEQERRRQAKAALRKTRNKVARARVKSKAEELKENIVSVANELPVEKAVQEVAFENAIPENAVTEKVLPEPLKDYNTEAAAIEEVLYDEHADTDYMLDAMFSSIIEGIHHEETDAVNGAEEESLKPADDEWNSEDFVFERLLDNLATIEKAIDEFYGASEYDDMLFYDGEYGEDQYEDAYDEESGQDDVAGLSEDWGFVPHVSAPGRENIEKNTEEANLEAAGDAVIAKPLAGNVSASKPVVIEQESDEVAHGEDPENEGITVLDDAYECTINCDLFSERYGYRPIVDIITGLNRTYKAYNQVQKAEDRRAKKERPRVVQAIVPFIENVFIFLLLAGLHLYFMDSPYIAQIDFILLYIVVVSITFGLFQATIAILLVSAFTLWQQANLGNSVYDLFTNIETVLRLLFLFVIAAICGHMKDKARVSIAERDLTIQDTTTELKMIYNINNQNMKIKQMLDSRLTNYENSLAKIYTITDKLNSLSADEVFFSAIKAVSEIMDSNDVSIYIVTGTSFRMCRLVAKSPRTAFAMKKSLKFDDLGDMGEAIDRDEIYVNRELKPNMPIMAAPVYSSRKLVSIIMLWSVEFEQLTTYQINNFLILSKLISSIIEKAYVYTNDMEATRHSSYSGVLNADAFKETIKIHVQAEKEGVAASRLFEVIDLSRGNELQDVAAKIKPMLRSTDYLGHGNNGELLMLLTNTNDDDAKFVENRMREIGIMLKAVKL